MKPAKIFYQYIWIISTLRTYRQLTLEQLSQRWQQDGVADGNPLPRSSFHRHRDAILDMFGIIIDCDPKTYCYYISNPEVLGDDSIEHWLFSTLAVHGVLADSASIKERVVLENVPAGIEFLGSWGLPIHFYIPLNARYPSRRRAISERAACLSLKGLKR